MGVSGLHLPRVTDHVLHCCDIVCGTELLYGVPHVPVPGLMDMDFCFGPGAKVPPSLCACAGVCARVCACEGCYVRTESQVFCLDLCYQLPAF